MRHDTEVECKEMIFLHRIWDHGFYDLGQLRYSRDIDLSCHTPNHAFVALRDHSPLMLQTDRVTGRQTDVMFVAY